MGANFLCGFKLPLMREEQIMQRVEIHGRENIATYTAQSKPKLFAIVHLSCWELLAQLPASEIYGSAAGSIYQTLRNPFLDALVRKRREARGYQLFPKSEGFSQPLKFLREENGALGVLVDQHAGDQGIWCPFFDRLASTTSLPGLLALRCKTPLLLMAVYNNGTARWRVVIQAPLQSGEAKPTAEGITAALCLRVENMIRLAPENWFWVHNRWKTPKPDFLLANYHRGVALPASYDIKRLQPFELIVRSPNWLGDACMAFPAVRALKLGRPDLRLTVLTPAKLSQLWSSLGTVDEVISKESKEGLLSVRKRIKSTGRHYDAGVLLTNSTRSTLEFWLAGIPRLAGYKGSLRSRLLHQRAPELPASQHSEHHAQRYMRLAEFCGAKTDLPQLWTTGTPRLAEDGIVRLGMCAGAEYGPAKRWPMDRFAEVANQIGHMAPGIEWLLFGAPGEVGLGEQLSSMIKVKHQNLVGKTGLDELIQKLLHCRLLLTNDTGTMHLAAALGVPTVSIFGSTEPVLTGPLGSKHTVLRHHVACSPCFQRECPLGHYECMQKITVSQATDAIVTELRKGVAAG
jgi:lipopolysaccharide heptosyltransferase II